MKFIGSSSQTGPSFTGATDGMEAIWTEVQKDELEQAIARLEIQQDALGDEVVDASIAALKVEFSALAPA